MDLFIVFFRDVLDGPLYFLYFFVCLFGIFYVFGISADRKRKAIEDKLKEKKKYDIISGREAAIAAMESKQVLDVEDDPPATGTDNQNATMNSALNSMSNMPDATKAQEEKAPNVMVLNSNQQSSDSQGANNGESSSEQKPDQPLVIDTSSLRS